jgi:hypothetical protein
MEKDLQILKNILSDMKYAPGYVDLLINHISKEFEKSSLSHITPQFVYSVLIFEEGRHKAKQISEYFEDFKKHGSYKNIVQKTIEKSPTFGKFK